MKRILTLVMMLLLGLGAMAGDRVTVVAWGTSTSDDEAKFLEDEGLKSGIGLSDIRIESGRLLFSGYYLPNQNANLRFTFKAGENWELTAGFFQLRKYWDTSAGHELTPAGYNVADWYPNTNTIAPLSDASELYTTRQAVYVKARYAVTPLQHVTVGFKKLTKDGDMTPMFRGFTFTGNVPFAATAASLRSYDESGDVAFAKANLAFGQWRFDGKVTVQSWDNGYTNTIGTYGLDQMIGMTSMLDTFNTDMLTVSLRLARDFEQGNVFGQVAYSKLDSDPANALSETGVYFNGARDGLGQVTRETTRYKLGGSWKITRRILLHLAATRSDRDQDGSYGETRTDYPATVDATSMRNVTTDQIRARARFLFTGVRMDLYTRYTSRDVADTFSTTISESGFDKLLFQDQNLNRDEWRYGLRASFRLPAHARFTAKVESYQQDDTVDLKDLTWGYTLGDAETDGLAASYRLSMAAGNWQLSLQGSMQDWDRDLAAPYFDPIYDPTQVLEQTATDGNVAQHVLSAATSGGNWSFNFRVGMISEEMSIQDPWQDVNYQPVEYDLDGNLYGLGGSVSGRAWTLSWDVCYVDTSGDQDNDRLRTSLDYSHRLSDTQSLVVQYRYLSFDESNFDLDDYQGHFLGIGWRYQF